LRPSPTGGTSGSRTVAAGRVRRGREALSCTTGTSEFPS
jgi:hypothetical protein